LPISAVSFHIAGGAIDNRKSEIGNEKSRPTQAARDLLRSRWNVNYQQIAAAFFLKMLKHPL
jgi:hypothetical protein